MDDVTGLSAILTRKRRAVRSDRKVGAEEVRGVAVTAGLELICFKSLEIFRCFKVSSSLAL